VKYAWIDAQRREFPLPDMCEVLAVSTSGYRAWRRGGTPDRTRMTDPHAVALMKSVHAEVKAAYGSRRMHRELQGLYAVSCGTRHAYLTAAAALNG
jgi:hypothetical protein